MYQSGSTKLVRSLNKNHILNLVRINSGITAREISNITGLQMSTVLYTLRALEKERLIENIGLGSSTVLGGKPPSTWSVSAAYGYILGAELLSTEVRLVIVNFKGELIHKEKFPLKTSATPTRIINKLAEIIQHTIGQNGIKKSKILGLGLAIPGSIDHHSGLVRYSFTLKFQEIEIRSILKNLINIPIQIDNDANAGALGIKWFSSQEQQISDIFYVSINQNFSGMGAGLIVNHQLYRGAHKAAGEIASFMTETTWKQFLKKTKDKYGDNCQICNSSITRIPMVSEVVEQAKKKDPGAIFILREIAKQISKKLIPLVDLIDPEMIVIGGDICESQEFIGTIIEDRVKSGVLSDCVRQTPIRFSPFGTFSVAMGSTALILQEIFNAEVSSNQN